MVELLVVIAIISILATISFKVYGTLVTNAKTAGTRATIKKIQGMIDERVQAFNRYMQGKENTTTARDDLGELVTRDATVDRGAPDATPPGRRLLSEGLRAYLLTQPSGSQTLLAIAGGNVKLARLLARKELYRQMLPQRWEDTVSQISASKYPSQYGVRPPNSAANEAESSEYLYEALTTNPVYGVPPVASDSFSTSEVRDTDDDLHSDTSSPPTLQPIRLEFVDAWGNPLRFYRCPTALTHPTGVNPPTGAMTLAAVPASPKSSDACRFNTPNEDLHARVMITSLPSDNSQYADPDDRAGLTLSPTWSGRTAFINNFHGFMAWHVPLIVSCGPNGNLGLYEPYGESPLAATGSKHYGELAAVLPAPAGAPNAASAGPLTDNITNLNFRAGGN